MVQAIIIIEYCPPHYQTKREREDEEEKPEQEKYWLTDMTQWRTDLIRLEIKKKVICLCFFLDYVIKEIKTHEVFFFN